MVRNCPGFLFPMIEKKYIPFLDDRDDNVRFNADYAKAIAAYDKDDKEAIKYLILDYLKLVPLRNYSMAFAVLDIACMEVQRSSMLRDLQKKDGTSRNDAEAVNRFTNGIKLAKEQIGIDPKTLATKGDGSMSEAFADVCGKILFDKRRFVCKPIFGKRGDKSTGAESVDEFKHMDDGQVDSYLESATAN